LFGEYPILVDQVGTTTLVISDDIRWGLGRELRVLQFGIYAEQFNLHLTLVFPESGALLLQINTFYVDKYFTY
jgi:hypothetical protein